jgi:hypothetical protein
MSLLMKAAANALALCLGGELAAAFGDEAALLGRGEGEGGEDFLGKLAEGDVVGGAELALPFGGGEDVPVFDGNPMDAGHVGCGEDAFEFEEFGIAGGAGGVHHEGVVGDATALRAFVFEVDEGEHFSADGFVAGPEDEVGAPLHGFDHVGKGEEVSAETFGGHRGKVRGSRCGVQGEVRFGPMPMRAVLA